MMGHRFSSVVAFTVALLTAAALLVPPPGMAQTAQMPDVDSGSDGDSSISPTCPDAGLFEGLTTKVCWDCMFPMILAGTDMGSGKSGPPGNWAEGTNTCTCTDDNGVPQPGLPTGMWKPIRLVEVVKQPYCSPSLGGIRLREKFEQLGGSESRSGDTRDKTFFSYHYFAFPLTEMMDLFVADDCNAGGLMDMDLMFLSELDPLWVDDELAFFQTPEITFISNPVAKAACLGDATAATAGHPLEDLFWCAGGWGNLYPFSGNLGTQHSPPQDTNLLATRALAGLHRRGQAWGTYGSDNSCHASIEPTLPKLQYKWSQFYPVAEANNKHWIGESSFRWGEWRNIPATGEDFVHLLWSWNDCCWR